MHPANAAEPLIEDVVEATFFGNASQVPVPLVPSEYILQNGAFAIRECGELRHRAQALRLIVPGDLPERIDDRPLSRDDLAFDHDLGIGRDHEILAPGLRSDQAEGLAQGIPPPRLSLTPNGERLRPPNRTRGDGPERSP